MLNTTSNTSAKRYAETDLESGINYTEVLTEGTEEIIAYHRVLTDAVRDNRIPGDILSMDEAEQMLITLHRLMYEAHAKVMHQKMMQAIDQKVRELALKHKEAAATASGSDNNEVELSNE